MESYKDTLYKGTFQETPSGGRVVYKEVLPFRNVYVLNMYLDEVKHSPDGFMWGYLGSGPHQLSYALLRDACGEETAKIFYKEFCRKIVSEIPKDEMWELTKQDIHDIVYFLLHDYE